MKLMTMIKNNLNILAILSNKSLALTIPNFTINQVIEIRTLIINEFGSIIDFYQRLKLVK